MSSLNYQFVNIILNYILLFIELNTHYKRIIFIFIAEKIASTKIKAPEYKIIKAI